MSSNVGAKKEQPDFFLFPASVGRVRHPAGGLRADADREHARVLRHPGLHDGAHRWKDGKLVLSVFLRIRPQLFLPLK